MPTDRPARFVRWWTLALLVAVGGCGGDRLSGGTNGTEAGNAVAARVLRPDGSAAAGALGIFRPSDAIDSSTSSKWIRAAADADGILHASIPAGSWTLEVQEGALAARSDFLSRESLDFTDTLRRTRDISGRVLDAAAGDVLHLPGLARSAIVASDGSFLFPAVPAGAATITDGAKSWTFPDTSRSGLILSPRWGALPAGAVLAWIPDVSDSNLAGRGRGVSPDPSSYASVDSLEGKVLGAPLGALVGAIDSGLLSDTGSFSMAVRARTTATGVSSLWLLHWTDATGAGLGLGIGGGRLVLRTGTRDTAVDVPADGSWHWYALSSNGHRLALFLDGSPILSLDSPDLGSRSGWTRRELGTGGALRIAAFLAWNREAAVRTVGGF